MMQPEDDALISIHCKSIATDNGVDTGIFDRIGQAMIMHGITVARPQRIWKYNIIYGRGRDRSGTQKAKLHVNT